MAGYVRRFTTVPTLEVIREIEGLVIIDLAPPAPATGAGSGTILLVGEFEDGYFATDEEAQGAVEVYGSNDYAHKFGSFGYTYANVKGCHPSARRALGEYWNGNGFLKSWKLKGSRLLISRVDTSVGEVALSPLATIKGTSGPWPLAIDMVLSATTNTGTGTTAAIAATAATVTGTGETFGEIDAGDSFGVTVDSAPMTTVVLSGADTTLVAVIARINATVGATVASASTTHLKLTGLRKGSGGRLVLTETTSGVLTKLGLTAGTTAGTGNVSDLSAVTAAEVAGLVNVAASMISAKVEAKVGSDGKFWLYHTVSAPISTLQVDVGTGGMGAALGFTLDTDVTVASHAGGTIPAGTRVQASTLVGSEWVTMQTVDVPAGATDPVVIKVRPGLDDGTHIGAGVGALNTLVDAPTFCNYAITNPSTISAALTEPQRDAAYSEALDATLNELGPCREANYLLVARRSDAVARESRNNAVTATEIGFFGRKYVMRDILGASPDHMIADVANFRRDRVFYAGLAAKTYVPVIAERGTAGGGGFTADGVITVGTDGPLCTLCASLPPEENPGQQTGLIDDFFAVNAYGASITIDTYKAFRRAGIAALRVDRVSGPIFQSGITTSLLSGEQTIARRRMADFIQDSAIGLFLPYSKRIARESVRNKLLGLWNQFLGGLESAKNPEKSRIYLWSTDDGINAGNIPSTLAMGVYYILTKVKTHPSLDFIVLQTEIGENAIITRAV